MRGFAVLLAFQWMGWLIQHLSGIQIPGNVLGLVLFIIALFKGWVPLRQVEEAASFLLKNMSLFFIPVIVGSITFFPYMMEHWLVMAGGGILSLVLTLVFTGWLTQKLLQRSALKKKEENKYVHHS